MKTSKALDLRTSLPTTKAKKRKTRRGGGGKKNEKRKEKDAEEERGKKNKALSRRKRKIDKAWGNKAIAASRLAAGRIHRICIRN